MKHNLKITLYLIALFFFAQLAGLAVLDQYIDKPVTVETGNVTFKELPNVGSYQPERPEVENKSYSFIPIIIAVLIGTAILLTIVKFNARRVWKGWFFVAISYVMFIALHPFIERAISFLINTINLSIMFDLAQYTAILICVGLAFFKVFRQNVYVHNFTELFLYGGLAAIFVDFLNLWSATILLLLISIYDAIAVWKSKHMITLANFQTDSKVFAGLFIPYKKPKPSKHLPEAPKPKHSDHKEKKAKNAILGGGDIAFPLLFAGAAMKTFGMGAAFVIVVLTTVALALLLLKSRQDKFYPAMPFISAGCFLGLGIVYLSSFLL